MRFDVTLGMALFGKELFVMHAISEGPVEEAPKLRLGFQGAPDDDS